MEHRLGILVGASRASVGARLGPRLPTRPEPDPWCTLPHDMTARLIMVTSVGHILL